MRNRERKKQFRVAPAAAALPPEATACKPDPTDRPNLLLYYYFSYPASK